MIFGTPKFLTVEQVLELHHDSLEAFGGLDGTRDAGLLESAVAAPQASFGGSYLLDSLFEMAAAYLWHLAKNHAFIDGNKRTALSSALVFLDLNGQRIDPDDPALYELTMGVAEGKLDKAAIAARLERLFTHRHGP